MNYPSTRSDPDLDLSKRSSGVTVAPVDLLTKAASARIGGKISSA
jgi:hypothetical protein